MARTASHNGVEMFFRAAIFLILTALACAAADRLYLKDGSYHSVREYEVKTDRVRYYSTERGDWEEIPLEMVDLKRTQEELTEQISRAEADAKADAEERTAAKKVRQQVVNLPTEPGAFLIESDEKTDALKKAEVKIVTDQKRRVLKLLSPIPVVPGKATIELDGEHAQRKISSLRPEFFFRLATEEEFEIIKLTAKKDARVAEKLSILKIQKEEPIVDEVAEIVPAFKKQEADLLYRVWPQKTLEPGEYALIEYTPGKMSPQVWDFSVIK
jgi:hypothetical protein